MKTILKYLLIILYIFLFSLAIALMMGECATHQEHLQNLEEEGYYRDFEV